MAEVLASLKKIGGNGEQYTETSLWTNPSPNSEFAPQTVTLSDSISNYKYIKFTYKHDSNNSTSDVSAIYIETNDFVMLTENAQTLAVAICARNSSNAPYNRQITYENGTSIKVHRAQVYNGTTVNNSLALPLEILGINELAHGAGVLATPFQLVLKSTVANGRSVIEFDKSTFPYTKFRVISKTNNLRYIGNGSWVTLAVGDIVDFSALSDTSLTIDVSGSTTSTQSSIEFYN